MVNYQNGKIYVVRCKTDDTNVYVGSTAEEKLSSRYAKYKWQLCCSITKYINEKYDGNWDNWYIELYENFPCNNKAELNKREGEVIRLVGTLNKAIAGRNAEQYRIDNKEILKQKYHDNKEKYAEKAKIYRENNIEKCKERSKNYRLNNM